MSGKTGAVVMTCVLAALVGVWATPVAGQLIDKNRAPNAADEGITRPLTGAPYPSQIGAGRSGEDWNASARVIALDPFRAIRRGRQLFQRKFTQSEGVGPITGDGNGDVSADGSIGAGLADSCAACHGRPRGAAGFGGGVVTRPDSRDAPHLFGLGLKEMLADEITTELRTIRELARARAVQTGSTVAKRLVSKGIDYGVIRALPGGGVDASHVVGVDHDLRVRPFMAHGDTISIREFVVGALKNEMGLKMAGDPDLVAAQFGPVRTASGMVLNGLVDRLEPLPAEEGDVGSIEQRAALVDFIEFYLFSYFKPGSGEMTNETRRGRVLMERIGCTSCHVRNLTIARDRRVADIETRFDPEHGSLNRLFATASLRLANPESVGQPLVAKIPSNAPFLVTNIFTDFKRHDLGPAFHERNYDGTVRTHFMTTALWGAGSTPPYGHDGRSINLAEVILRHGGEAQDARDAFAALSRPQRNAVVEFLESLIVFPPDDTASNLDPGEPGGAGYPQWGHGSIRLSVLFNDPTVVE